MMKNAMPLPRVELGVGCSVCAVLLVGLFACAQNKPARQEQEQERKIQEPEVPRAALDALRKLAERAPFTEFAEEIEHGHKFYEGSWTGPNGNVDALVTETGDLVEIEEMIPADRVPAAVRAEVAKTAGRDAKPTFEKKTLVMYEVHFTKDGKGHEMILTPDGRRYHEEAEENGEDDKDD